MGLGNFIGLSAAIVSYANRDGDVEFEEMVPSFIELCESRLNRQLRLREQETVATISIASGSGNLPDDFLEVRELRSNGSPKRVLELAAPGYGDTAFMNAATGVSSFYSLSGLALKTYPPSSSSLSISYYAKIPPLSLADSTNWLLSKAPEVYLYGSLVESAPFMMDDQRLSVWGTLFERAVKDLISDDARAKYARAGVRVTNWTP